MGGGDRGAGLVEIAHRLDEHDVDSARHQAAQLIGEQLLCTVGCQRAQGLQQLAGRPEVASHQDPVAIGHRAGDAGRSGVDLVDTVLETVPGEPAPGAAEGVRREDLGARRSVFVVQLGDSVGLVDVPVLSDLAGRQATLLQQPAITAIEDGRSASEKGRQSIVRHRRSLMTWHQEWFRCPSR